MLFLFLDRFKNNNLKKLDATNVFNVRKYEDAAILKTYEAANKNYFHEKYIISGIFFM